MMMLPTFSISRPKQDGTQRLVFDWGKSIAHPGADIAFAFLASEGGQYIQTLVFRDIAYTVHDLKDCRSGRIAAILKLRGPVDKFEDALITELVRQEFPAGENTM